ncbi:putative nicotinate-nucleotide adenylyltransferase [Halioglobus japonicus]|nr:putative nicotinate-nucleotide adenylyltransferase [Halioglobus japonicus]
MSDAGASGLPLVGVFGGTFNPVHYGHLRSALELVERLQLVRLHLMPSAQPPHREAPECSAVHRAAMVELAVAGEPRLSCDLRELQRAGKSYMIDSLIELRGELGAGTGLCMVLGCDAVLDITTWYRWQELLDWAHIVVISRPGWELPQEGDVAQWLQDHRVEDANRLRDRPAGCIAIEELRPLAISATEIREMLAAGRSARYLLPQSVLDYIQTNKLYR